MSKYFHIFLFIRLGCGFDVRTGGGGMGLEGYDIFQSDVIEPCPILDGTVAALTCNGVTPAYDLKSGHSSVSIVDAETVYEVVYKQVPFREFGVVTSSRTLDEGRDQLTFHIVDSAEYSSCEQFVTSPTGIDYCNEHGVAASDCVSSDHCELRRSGAPGIVLNSCLSKCQLPPYPTSTVQVQRRRHTKAKWDFEYGLEGWGNATSSEMEAEIYALGGELRGTVLGTSGAGSAPHFDSPRLSMVVNDKHHLLLRMMYTGPARTGRVIFRTGSSSPSSRDHKLSTWDNRENASAVRWSPGSVTPEALVDGSVHTGWSAPSDGAAWVVIDLHAHYEVSELEIIAVVLPDSTTSLGPNQAPMTMRLQVGDSPDGTFSNVFAFHLNNGTNASVSTDNQETLVEANGESQLDDKYKQFVSQVAVSNEGNKLLFAGFKTIGRFFRLYCDNSFGGQRVEVRELTMRAKEDSFVSMDFAIVGDGQWRTYTIPFHEKLQGHLTQVRVYPCVKASFRRGSSQVNAYRNLVEEQEMKAILKEHQFSQGGETDDIDLLNSPPPLLGNAFAIDWITISVAPTVMRVMGCHVNKYYETESMEVPLLGSLSSSVHYTNNYLRSTSFSQADWVTHQLPYATTYNCLKSGGERVNIYGKHLGLIGTTVSVAELPCRDVEVVVEEYHLRCTLPSLFADNGGLVSTRDVEVTVQQGDLPLKHTVRYLSFKEAPPQMLSPTLSNIASRSIDVSWICPGDLWTQLTVTGYLVRIRQFGSTYDMFREVTVGNVTTTTITGLLPDTAYTVSVAAVAENVEDESWRSFDLYGRRSLLPDAEIGTLSVETNVTSTLTWDLEFDWFDANATTNQSAQDRRYSMGPSGVVGGEGGYGLVIVGDANLENCNESIACCDGYNYSLGITSCTGRTYSCSAVASSDPYYVDGVDVNARSVPYSDPDGSPSAPKQVRFWSVMASERNALRPSAPCGPALRLTPSLARQAGAVWYARKLNVEEGFDTVFSFRISSPSVRCAQMDDAYTHCRSRGGDGIAFVIQEQDPRALGAGGAGLGYTGIENSLAVEFDTFYNSELLEPYENHVAVHSRGWRSSNNANHSFSLASSVQIADLTRDVHVARVAYKPSLEVESLLGGKFISSPHAAHFFENADFPGGGMADFGTGVGQLEVYLDDMNVPVLVTAVNLGALLKLYHGRAWVGFTAATGHNTWQTQDLLSWHFNQLRLDKEENPTPVVNGVGAFSCADQERCVHK